MNESETLARMERVIEMATEKSINAIGDAYHAIDETSKVVYGVILELRNLATAIREKIK